MGAFLAKGIAILAGVGPLIQPLFGSASGKASQVVSTISQDLTAIGQVVVTAEALIQTAGSGAAKLAAAAPLVTNIVKTSELVSGHKIKDEALFLQGCTNLTSAVAQILNSLSGDGVNSQGSPLPATPPAQTAPVPAALVTPPAVAP